MAPFVYHGPVGTAGETVDEFATRRGSALSERERERASSPARVAFGVDSANGDFFFYFFLSVRDLLPAQVGARLRGRETAGSGASYPESLSCRPLPASAEAQETV